MALRAVRFGLLTWAWVSDAEDAGADAGRRDARGLHAQLRRLHDTGHLGLAGRRRQLAVPPPPPPPPPRTKWTRRVPHPVLIGHAASLTPY